MVVKFGKLWPALEQFGEGYSTVESKPHCPVCGRVTPFLSTISHECSVDSDPSPLIHVCRTGARERLSGSDQIPETHFIQRKFLLSRTLAHQCHWASHPGGSWPACLPSQQDVGLDKTRDSSIGLGSETWELYCWHLPSEIKRVSFPQTFRNRRGCLVPRIFLEAKNWIRWQADILSGILRFCFSIKLSYRFAESLPHKNFKRKESRNQKLCLKLR